MKGNYESTITGMWVNGQMGGANGHFLAISFFNPMDNKEYQLNNDSRGLLYFRPSKYPSKGTRAASSDYDINEYVILYGTNVGDGFYDSILLQNPRNNRQVLLDSNGIHINAKMSPIYRRKAIDKPKPRRKMTMKQRCTCKK